MIKVTILGSASAKPTVDRHPSAQVVNVDEQLYLVDAGEGVQQQMFRYGISPLKLRAVFVSHLHGDHVFGLFPLLSTMGLYGRRTALKVYAPRPFGEMLDAFRHYFEDDLPYPVEWVEVDTTKHRIIFENRTLEVWSIPLRHKLPSSGFLFKEKPPQMNVRKEMIEQYGLTIAQIVAAKSGEDIVLENGCVVPNEELTYMPREPRSYAYCSDTNRSAMVARRVAGVNLLYHEATYATAERKQARERGHATAAEAAIIADAGNVGRLLIGHFSSRYKDFTVLLNEAKEIFQNTDIATEGETYIV